MPNIKLTSLMILIVVFSMLVATMGMFVTDAAGIWSVSGAPEISSLNYIQNVSDKVSDIEETETSESTETSPEQYQYNIWNSVHRGVLLMLSSYNIMAVMITEATAIMNIGVPSAVIGGIMLILLIVAIAAVINAVMKRDV